MIEEDVVRPWDRREGEDEVWYRIFSRYYLPLGTKRDLRTAFEFYIRTESPPDYSGIDPETLKYIPKHWPAHAREWEWASRAAAYDEASIPDFAEIHVSQTLQYLRAHALTAADALVAALSNERTRVQAANSILNRSGVPEVSEVNLKAGVTVTADEMAAAREKVDEWTTQKQSG
jgi:hypothetical protein